MSHWPLGRNLPWLLLALSLLTAAVPAATGVDPIVFVSRQIPPGGSIYWNVPRDMPGVGPHSRFRPAAPGKLLVRNSDGSLRVLVDGAQPTAASLQLIDVNAPDVSYDGTEIVFAGLPAGVYDPGTVTNPGAWRLYRIRADGTALRVVTRSDQVLDLSQFGVAARGLRAYDDTDPAWLPDGRIVFSSTRWPSYAQYSGVRTTNLYVVDDDGTNLHRVTAERNGADRPQVDPLTGKVVYARWWRNQRFAIDDLGTVADPKGGYARKDGLTTSREVQLDGTAAWNDYLWRNVWNLASVNPDGTDLKAWTGSFLQTGDGNAGHAYGGAFTPAGDLLANFFPMMNMTEAAGFGGIRRYTRGPTPYRPVIGLTDVPGTLAHPSDPPSYGIAPVAYASDATPLSDGGLVISWAPDVNQDYGLVRIDADGTGFQTLYDAPGTTELRARSLTARPRPPIIRDAVTHRASPLPPFAKGPFDRDGTFTFDALNVYANAAVDTDIVSAPAVGSARSLRFFIDHQRTSPGSFPNLDWPILLAEQPVRADGSVRNDAAPADVPLFEQLRSPTGRVPVTRGPLGALGAAHVAGMNFGRPGTTSRCVGCHIGHSMIEVPSDPAEASWSNLAPGAVVTVSSVREPDTVQGLTDRRAKKALPSRIWGSKAGAPAKEQWIQLEFSVPIAVRTVRIYAPSVQVTPASSLTVQGLVVRLLDSAGGAELARAVSSPITAAGTDVSFDAVVARVVRIEFSGTVGNFLGSSAALAEVEVVGRGESAR